MRSIASILVATESTGRPKLSGLKERTTDMAYASAHHTRTAGIFAPIADAFSALRATWARSRSYMRAYNELNALSTRDLADLGISRSMISRLAYEAAYGRDA